MSGGGGEGGSEYEVNINLTALLDVLTNLLFFLMFGFAAQQSSIELEAKLELPSSTAELPPKKTINITVGQDKLLIEKDVIAGIKAGKVEKEKDDGRIEALYRRLSTLHDQRVASSAPNEDNDVLFIICDRKAPYSLLKRVMMTGAEAGFPKFRMAVLMQ